MECCMEFMRMISDETSQLCAKEGKSTIGADHVLKVMLTWDLCILVKRFLSLSVTGEPGISRMEERA